MTTALPIPPFPFDPIPIPGKDLRNVLKLEMEILQCDGNISGEQEDERTKRKNQNFP